LIGSGRRRKGIFRCLLLEFQPAETLVVAKALHFPDAPGSLAGADDAPQSLVIDIPLMIEHRFIVDELYIFEIPDKISAWLSGVTRNAETAEFDEGR
jgi:hypothetical protein